MLRSSSGWTSSHCTDPTIVTARRHAASVGGSPSPSGATLRGSKSYTSHGPMPYSSTYVRIVASRSRTTIAIWRVSVNRGSRITGLLLSTAGWASYAAPNRSRLRADGPR